MTTNEENQSEDSKPRSIVSLALWALVAIAAVAAGFATPYVSDQLQAAPSDSGSQSPDETPPALIEFGEVTVNLNESRLNRYLRLEISFLVDQKLREEVTKDMEENKPILKSWLLSHLADKAMEDIRGAAGQHQLRREIRQHFNSLLFPNRAPQIKTVLFREFNIQ